MYCINFCFQGHAYTITKVVPEHGLVRIRNPWGRAEWTGAWSDKSPEWKNLSDIERKDQNLVVDDDGEFFMSIEDLVRNFSRITICNLSHLEPGLAWNEEKIFGSWIKNISAGGYVFDMPSFATNPQFKFILKDSDADNDNLCTTIVALMQKTLTESELFPIGFRIYLLKDWQQEATLDEKFLESNAEFVEDSGDYHYYPEVTRRFELKPGAYVIIPSTIEPNQEREFMLRIFSEKECHLQALKPTKNSP